VQQNAPIEGISSRKEQNVEQHKDAQRAFDTYGDMVYRLALMRTQSQPDAEDIVQEVFLRYLRSAPEKVDAEHEKAWLIRVCINCAKSWATAAWRQKTVSITTEIEGPQLATASDEVYEAVARLPENYRLVIHLFYYEGYKTAEIATLLSANDATVRSWLHRAREQLRQTIVIEDEE
jgi:RNA polymerase sigma-70 factor (ECF subfamily)